MNNVMNKILIRLKNGRLEQNQNLLLVAQNLQKFIDSAKMGAGGENCISYLSGVLSWCKCSLITRKNIFKQ